MKLIILYFFVLLQFTAANAQPIVHLQDTGHLKPIGKNTTYYRDDSYADIQKIVQPAVQSQFELYSQDAPNFGSIADAVWIKFTITKNVDKDFYLQIGSAFIDSIALYAMDGNQVSEVQFSGDNYVFSQRAIKVTTFLFPLNLPDNNTRTYFLRVKTMQPFFFPLRVGTLPAFIKDTHKLDFIQGIYFGFMLLIFLYNLFLYFSTKEKLYLFYVAYVGSITWFMSTIYQYVFEYLWPGLPVLNQYAVASTALTILTATLFTRAFLHTQKLAPGLHKISIIFIVWGILVFILVFTPFKIAALMLAQAGIMIMAIFFLVAGVTVFRKGYQPAKFYLIAWSFLIAGFIAAILETVNILPVNYYFNSMQIGSAIEVMLLSLALADRINLYKKQKEEAQKKALSLAQEKSDFILEQNILLEQKVNDRTIELSKSLDDLKATQTQLIQSEKMASLGELTAGIAHEIQNPLNFVNNFSEVSIELLNEMEEAVLKSDREEINAISTDVKHNLEKIHHHGKRADAIVKGMLQHSRSSSGKKELTDINALCDEYLRLSYHGLRAKDKSFNATMKTDFDESIGKINIIPQDIGRVILNLINNAFYAVNEKYKRCQAEPVEAGEKYEPTVTICTKRISSPSGGRGAEISVTDNGNGIPQNIVDKIFQPFFTTKPTGQGTGLGLSLAFDIITKGHGGTLKVETKTGKGTTFTVELPGSNGYIV